MKGDGGREGGKEGGVLRRWRGMGEGREGRKEGY
jgi:hypothetical protein